MMNKKILSIIALAGLGVFMTSCADDSLSPIITFDKAGKGAYVKLLEENTRLINLLDIPSSTYVYSVEFVDLEQGGLVSEYALDVIYDDNNPDNGDNSVGPVSFRSYSPSDFIDTDRGFKGINDITITPDELFRAAGVDASSVKAGDVFTIDGGLILLDGSEFRAANSTATVNGAAFGGHFRFDIPAGCPSDLTGEYAFAGSNFWCNGGSGTGTLSINALGGGAYSFSDWSFGAYDACYGGFGDWGSLAFTDVCEEITFTGRTDAFGDTWNFTHSFDGEEWSITWDNTYGESGSAVVTKSGGWGLIAK